MVLGSNPGKSLFGSLELGDDDSDGDGVGDGVGEYEGGGGEVHVDRWPEVGEGTSGTSGASDKVGMARCLRRTEGTGVGSSEPSDERGAGVRCCL